MKIVLGLILCSIVTPTLSAKLDTAGVVTIRLHGCKINEVVPVGGDRTHQDLGVECEDGSGYRIVVR